MGEERTVHQPHDKGYRYLLSSKKVFMDLLRHFVKQGWVESIDEASVIKLNKSFILQDFADKEADIVYQVKIKENDVIFYILMEMQSSVDYQMPFRLLNYMMEIWRDILKNTDRNEAARKEYKLPVIVPIVLYNGQQTWTVHQRFKETLSEWQMFHEQVIDFGYILLDVNRYSEEELLQVTNLMSSIFLLEQAKDVSGLNEKLKKVLKTWKDLTDEEMQLLRVWMRHILAPRMGPEMQDKVHQVIEETSLGGMEMIIHGLERVLDEMREQAIMEGKLKGMLEGRQEGIMEGELKGKYEVARNMIAIGMSLELVVKLTGLSEQDLEPLLKHTH